MLQQSHDILKKGKSSHFVLINIALDILYNLMQKQTSLNKRQKQLISRFNYHSANLNELSSPSPNSNTRHAEKDMAQTRYNYTWSARDNFKYFELITKELLASVTEKVYSNAHKQSTQINKSNLPLEEIQTHIFSYFKQKTNKTESNISKTRNFNNPQQYQILILHHSSNSSLWFYYVERITLTKLAQNQSSLVYQSVIAIKKQTGFLSYILRPFMNKDTVSKLGESFQEKLKQFCSTLQKQLKSLKIKYSKQQQKSHTLFKRQDRIPTKEYENFQKLKKQIYSYYSLINPNKKINSYSIDNLICRFMKFKEYHYLESLKGVKAYLDWQKKIRGKYTKQDFEKYDSLKLYEIVGKDRQGRIILFFRSHKIIVETVKNQQEYVDYCMYMLDLFIQDNTEGYIDDFILLADYRQFSSQNYKLSMVKSVSEQSKDLFPDRQYKLICFGLGTFSYFIFKIIKNFLPKFVLQKIAIFGTDKQELKQFLSQYMDIEQLPAQILGQPSPNQN